MKRKETHYQLLGIEPSVSSKEIKRAYRSLVKDFHPDVEHNGKTSDERSEATERMMHLNEAYATLMDSAKRAAYDASIGLRRGRATVFVAGSFVEEDEARERYLKKVFHPSRQSVSKVLGMYQSQMRKLSQDIYDDELLAAFERYVDRVETTLRAASDSFTQDGGPESLAGAVRMMRYSIAQAADGLDELRRFCQNYDYDHLSMAGNLFRIAQDLSKQSLQFTRI